MITRVNDRLMMNGRLTMYTVPALYEAGRQMLAKEDLLIDMAKVESVDSAAVSLLLAWSRVAQGQQRTLRVANLPADLLSLANLYGVAEMLPK
ncbi:MAG: STAS domain-containing protein [Gallionella sp.]